MKHSRIGVEPTFSSHCNYPTLSNSVLACYMISAAFRAYLFCVWRLFACFARDSRRRERQTFVGHRLE